MKTSAAGRALITQREGRKLEAYRDIRGIWTIGVGHVDMMPPKTVMGMKITAAQADAMLAADLGQVEAVINKAVTVPMTQNEFDAVASLGFNIGVTGLRKSTVIKRFNLGDVTGAAEAFMLWSKPAVLIGRRKAEKAQFLTPDAPTSADPAPSHAIVKARAATLRAKAGETKDKADAAQVGAAGSLVAGAATVAATHAHHPWLAFALGGGILVAGGIAAAAAILGNRKAQTLTANAGVQAQRAKALTPVKK